MQSVWCSPLEYAAGILFAIDPGLDIYISKLVFVSGGRVDNGIVAGILSAIREFHIKLFAVIIAVSAGALVLRMMFAKMPMLVPARAAWFILLTYLVGPGLVANAVFKENWSRPRPAHVTEFGGAEKFKPWWDPSGTCPKNCSFVSGEASAGFAVLAIAVLAPAAWRLPAIALALGFGIFVGVAARRGGRTFHVRCGLCRRADGVRGVAAARTDLSLAGHPHQRKPGRAARRCGRARACAPSRSIRSQGCFPISARLRPRDAKARDVRQLDEQPSG